MTVLPSSAIATTPKFSVDSTRTVTRGESPEEGFTTSKTLIDWLSVTFKKPSFTIQFLLGILADYMGCDLRGVDRGKGMHGFESSVSIEADANGKYRQIGYILFGGESQRGRWMLDLSGSGCGLVQDWEALQDLLENLGESRITRCDLACDFLEGEKTVDDAVEMFQSGEFTMNGRPPQVDTTGDWLTGQRGRTLYVGKRSNGKQLCIYEKGKQLGDYESNWTRYELRLGNRDREIPFDILTNPDRYFAGAYPALQALLDEVQGERIDTISKEAHINYTQLVFHARRCYGKLFSSLANIKDYDVTDLIETITVAGSPRRLDPSLRESNITWPDIKEELKRL